MPVPIIEIGDRTPGRVVSLPVPSDLVAVPVVDGVPQWDTPNSTVVGLIEIIAPAPPMRFDMSIEGTDDPAGLVDWYPLIEAKGMSAVGTTRDGSDFVPRIEYRSTTVLALFMRLVVESNLPARYAATVEVT